MKTGKASRFMIGLVLTAYLIIGGLNVPGLVLCFETDGRISLETAIEGVCSDSLAEKNVAAIEAVSDEPCNRCTDISVGLNIVEPQPHANLQELQGQSQEIVALAPLLVPVPNLAMLTMGVSPQPPPSPHRPIHQILGSIVLLI